MLNFKRKQSAEAPPWKERRGEEEQLRPSRVMASLFKAHLFQTSKLKSSLMLFIFKCYSLDRQHLVRHTSHGRPWCSTNLGSITCRQPLAVDTKAVPLVRDLLWNLSQSCIVWKKKKKTTNALSSPVYTHVCCKACLLYHGICHLSGIKDAKKKYRIFWS